MDTPQDSQSTVMVSGYATAPAGTALHSVYGTVGMVLEIDPRTHEILDADFLVVTRLANDFLRRLYVGANFVTDLEVLAERTRTQYLAPSAAAMAVALRSASDRYGRHVDQLPNDRG